MKLSIYGETNDGRQRDHNEDSFLILADVEDQWAEINDVELDTTRTKGIVCVVADGMGGTNAGEVASAIAVQTVKEEFKKRESLPSTKNEIKKFLTSLVQISHKKIVKEARRGSETDGMGTTIIICWILGNILYVTWSGDSRSYLFNPGKNSELKPFTDDHSLVWEHVKKGELTSEEARLSDESNLILQSLGGSGQKPDPDFKWKELNNLDRIIICSDGLNSMLSDVGIQQIIEFEHDTRQVCRALIDSANNAGGHDNITSIVIDVKEKNEEVIDSDDNQAKKKKRVWKYLLAILFILMILTGIYFIDVLLSAMRIKPVENQNYKILYQDSAIEEMNQQNISAESGNEREPIPSLTEDLHEDTGDSIAIQDTLRSAAGDLLWIKKHLIEAEQSNTPSFIEENGQTLENISKQLNNLEDQISKVASYNSDTLEDALELIIHDYSLAFAIHLELLKACQELRKDTESLVIPEDN